MNSYLAFTKKEFTECIRSSKMVIMAVVFLLIGIMNPVLAKVTPDILKSLASEGMTITVADPTALDSWTQFYKNMPQFGLIVLVIIFSGILTNEISKGTLINMLTKGLKRSIVIYAKMTMAAVTWTLSFLIAFGVSYGYTVYFWPEDSCDNLFLAATCLWLFGLLLLAAIMLGSVLLKGIAGSLLFTGGFIAIMFVLDIFPKVSDYNPILLASGNMGLITGVMEASDVVKPVVVSVVLMIAFLLGACSIFNKKFL